MSLGSGFRASVQGHGGDVLLPMMFLEIPCGENCILLSVAHHGIAEMTLHPQSRTRNRNIPNPKSLNPLLKYRAPKNCQSYLLLSYYTVCPHSIFCKALRLQTLSRSYKTVKTVINALTKSH